MALQVDCPIICYFDVVMGGGEPSLHDSQSRDLSINNYDILCLRRITSNNLVMMR